MDTPAKCTKSIAVGKKSNPSYGPTQHRKDTFHKKGGYRVSKMI